MRKLGRTIISRARPFSKISTVLIPSTLESVSLARIKSLTITLMIMYTFGTADKSKPIKAPQGNPVIYGQVAIHPVRKPRNCVSQPINLTLTPTVVRVSVYQDQGKLHMRERNWNGIRIRNSTEFKSVTKPTNAERNCPTEYADPSM